MSASSEPATIGEAPDPEVLAEEIATLATHLDAATHRLLTCIRTFDASEEWGRQGFISCAHWLVWRINLDPGASREKVRVARALGTLPRIDDALRQGVLSYAKARALTRVATPENEERLLDCSRYCTGAQLERLCRQLRKVDVFSPHGDRLDEHRLVKQTPLESGLVRLTAVLHPDEAELVMKAIELARRSPAPPPSPAPMPIPAAVPAEPPASIAVLHASAEGSPVQSSRASAEVRSKLLPRPDALVRMAQSFLAHQATGRLAAEQARILLHVDQDFFSNEQTLAATLDDGTRVSAETFRRLSCDAIVTPHPHDAADDPASAGPATAHHAPAARSRRTVGPLLRRRLWLRDHGCRFPGCTHNVFLHAHHVWHWAHGGPTTADNLVLLCTMHHRLVHEGGFHVTVAPDGHPSFTDPRGRPIHPTWVPAAIDGVETLVTWNADAGLDIDAETAFPLYDGEPIDYRWIVDLLAAREPPRTS